VTCGTEKTAWCSILGVNFSGLGVLMYTGFKQNDPGVAERNTTKL
jgi:hypothetical protein